MNKVVGSVKRNTPEEKTVFDIVGSNLGRLHTAFIGHIGHNKGSSELFLVCFNCIMQANDPTQTWSCDAPITIEKWVDIEIVIVED